MKEEPRRVCREAQFARLTELFKHLVALIKNEVFNVFGVEKFVSDEGIEATGGGNDDVRALSLVLEGFSVLGNGSSSIECANANIGHVLGKARVLVLDLECQFTRVAENEDRHFTVHGLELLQRRKDENGSLAMSRLSLAQNVHAKHRLWNALLLHYSDVRNT